MRPGPFVSTAPVVMEGPGIGLSSEGAARRFAMPATVLAIGAALGVLLLARGPFAPVAVGDAGSSMTPSPAPSRSLAPVAVATPAPPTATPTPVPSATPAPTPSPRPRSYKVRRGDTLSSIAAKFGTTSRKLAKLNGIDNPSLIRVGQVLTLP